MPQVTFDNIYNYFNVCDNISVVYGNNLYSLSQDNVLNIQNLLFYLCNNSHEMPAIGVSIHNETIKAMRTGMWLKLKYNTTLSHNGMSFDELIININSNDYGFNIIRGNNGVYDGRCYYVSLEKNIVELYNTLLNMIN